MTRISITLVAALAALVAAIPAQAAPTKLVATVGPNFNITLTKGGKKVRTLTPGKYVITVRDRSTIHNFHLKGPGVNKDSGIVPTGTKTWRVTLKKGKYVYVCDPHLSTMKGTVRVV